jgi:hypothetical protein
MPEQSSPNPARDSLDIVEHVMAIEEAIATDLHLTPNERERLMREIEARIERGEIGDRTDFDDDAPAALVRRLGPRGPLGLAGAAVKPEELTFE